MMSSVPMSRKMLALVVALLAMYNAVHAQEQSSDDLFPAPHKQPWELPMHPMDPRVNSEGTPQNSVLPNPYFSDPTFKNAMPGVRGYVPQGVVAEAMGVRTEANSWLHENMHPGMLPPTPQTAQPLIYHPVYSVLGSGDVPNGLTVPVASRASGPVDTPDAANPSTLPPSWNILTSPEVPLPPQLAPAPVPPIDDMDREHADKKHHAVLMEIQAKTAAKQKEQMLQSQSAELARLRAAAAAKPVPVRTVTTTTYYSNPYQAGAMSTTFDRQPFLPEGMASSPAPTGPLTDAAPAKLQEKSITSFAEKDSNTADVEEEEEVPTAPLNRIISYNRFKKGFDVHNNAKSGTAAYERSQNGNLTPFETQTEHLPSGWHKSASLTESFTAAHDADVHESAYMRARETAEATAMNNAAHATAAPVANETEAETEAGAEQASFMETEADADGDDDEEEEEEEEADVELPIKDNSDPVYQKFKPRHTAPTHNHRALNAKERHYRKQLIRDAIEPIVAMPIVHQVIPLRELHDHYRHDKPVVVTRDDIRRAPAVPAPGSFLPRTKMGMLSEFIHAAKNNRFNTVSPFEGSMLQTDEASSSVLSSRKPYGTPKFAAMRAPPQ